MNARPSSRSSAAAAPGSPPAAEPVLLVPGERAEELERRLPRELHLRESLPTVARLDLDDDDSPALAGGHLADERALPALTAHLQGDSVGNRDGDRGLGRRTGE